MAAIRFDNSNSTSAEYLSINLEILRSVEGVSFSVEGEEDRMVFDLQESVGIKMQL